MTELYAGDVLPRATWDALESDPAAVLIDVRTQPEWNYVGLPDLSRIGKTVIRVEWQNWPDGAPNPHFVEAVSSAGVMPDQKVFLLCRSGARSRSAAELLTRHGWKFAFNVLDGFEGPHDPSKHRGTVAGWKHDGLPWAQG